MPTHRVILRKRVVVWAIGALAVAACLGAGAAGAETGDLVPGEGVELVRTNCGVCHSLRTVTQTRATRAGWESLLRWMQRTQNLWAFPPEREAAILDYLATHYAPEHRSFRRAPLAPELLPPR